MISHAMIPATGTAYIINRHFAEVSETLRVIGYTTTAALGQVTTGTIAIGKLGSPEILTVRRSTGDLNERSRSVLFVVPEGTPVNDKGEPAVVAEYIAYLREWNAAVEEREKRDREEAREQAGAAMGKVNRASVTR